MLREVERYNPRRTGLVFFGIQHCNGVWRQSLRSVHTIGLQLHELPSLAARVGRGRGAVTRAVWRGCSCQVGGVGASLKWGS